MRGPSIFSLAFYIVALVLGSAIITSAGDIAATHARLAEILSPEARTEAAWREVLETLSLGVYAGAEQARLDVAALNTHILTLWERTNWLSAGLAAWLGLHLCWHLWRSAPLVFRTHMLLSASICLVIGLFAPMLSIVAQREVPMLGEVVLRYESKAILATIGTLAGRQHFLIAAALALTSVVIPVLKLLLAAVAIGENSRFRTQSRRALHSVGKWSLTDVFVVAVLLAFMAGDTGDSTNAWIGHGLWFFAGYAVLSWVVTQQLESKAPSPVPTPAPTPKDMPNAD